MKRHSSRQKIPNNKVPKNNFFVHAQSEEFSQNWRGRRKNFPDDVSYFSTFTSSLPSSAQCQFSRWKIFPVGDPRGRKERYGEEHFLPSSLHFLHLFLEEKVPLNAVLKKYEFLFKHCQCTWKVRFVFSFCAGPRIEKSETSCAAPW